jgi:hypothetical protein
VTSSTSSEAGGGEPGGVDALQPLPVEARAVHGWLRACVRTLARTLTRPSQSFLRAPEPVAHGRVLGYLATLRLPAWALLVAIEGARVFDDATRPLPMRSIHAVLDAPLVQALTAWLILMVPVGLPLLYFFGGLIAHLGIALTGGASRSIGASMRAVGYAAGPALLAVAVLDLPLYLADMPALVYLGSIAAVTVLMLVLGGVALARTHQLSLMRGWVVMLLPAVLLAAVSLGRAALVLRELPGLPVPDQPYYVP